jgi:signal transduction histidine kinase
VAITKQQLIGKLKHEINNPLAAIRNALYLALIQNHDPELECFLKLADAEVSRIANILRNANQIDENTRVRTLMAIKDIASAA